MLLFLVKSLLTQLGQVTHIYWLTRPFFSDKPVWHQAMITFSWTLRIYFCEIWIEIQQFNSTGLDIKHLVYMPIGHVVLKIYVPCKNFDVPSQYICTSPVKLVYTTEKISACPDWKITCPVRHVTTKVYVSLDKIYMPWARGHALMSTPVQENGFENAICNMANILLFGGVGWLFMMAAIIIL